MGFKKIQFLMTTGVLANTEATKSPHSSACKLTTYPFVQYVSLVNRVKDHLQAKEAQWSRTFKHVSLVNRDKVHLQAEEAQWMRMFKET